MTIETIHRLKLTDLERVSFECRECGSALVLKIKAIAVQSECPKCHAPWIDEETLKRVFTAFANGLRLLLDQDADLRFVMRFEAKPPTEPSA